MLDNKITKQRIDTHLEYDWYKYLIIPIVAIFLWYFVVTTCNGNRDYEIVQFFIAAESIKDDNYSPALERAFKDAGEKTVREVAILSYSVSDSMLHELIRTQGTMSSDIIILPESVFKNYTNAFIPLSDRLVGEIDGGKTLEFFKHENSETRYGVRIDAFSSINTLIETQNGDEYQRYYMAFLNQSTNMGEYNRHSSNSNAQAVFAARHFIDYFY